MNPSPLFRETREDVLYELMREHPFATLVSSADGTLSADHAPLVLHEGNAEEPSVLRGHLAGGNALVRTGESPIEVLVIFQGPQAHITPSWYASKAKHGKVVPTWNYVVVHARGTLSFVRDAEWLMAHLHTLTDTHEGPRPKPWAVTDAPPEFVGAAAAWISRLRGRDRQRGGHLEAEPKQGGAGSGERRGRTARRRRLTAGGGVQPRSRASTVYIMIAAADRDSSRRCPICARSNGCAIAQGGAGAACWCARTQFCGELLDWLKGKGVDERCLCADCAGGNVPSPCTRECRLDEDGASCLGCGRTLEEITGWGARSPVEKALVLLRLQGRLES